MTEESGPTAAPETTATHDVLSNVLLDGICGDIRFALKHGRNRAALVLIYAGIDAMASLERTTGKKDVQKHYVAWVDEFMKFEEWPEAGLELYGARCGLLHRYSAISDLSARKAVRPVGYTIGVDAGIRQDGELVLISVERLAQTFFHAIARYLDVLIADGDRRRIAIPQLRQMFHEFDLDRHHDAR